MHIVNLKQVINKQIKLLISKLNRKRNSLLKLEKIKIISQQTKQQQQKLIFFKYQKINGERSRLKENRLYLDKIIVHYNLMKI